jgi:protein-tyrosine phosphatase
MIKILFVCHGNICRSPMAEFIMKDLVKTHGLEDEFLIASAATSTEEIGNPVHPGTRRKLKEAGISCEGKYAVQLTRRDYAAYDFLIGMDHWNLKNMKQIVGSDPKGKLHLLLDFTDRPRDISDPWYTGDFDKTYWNILEGCKGFLEQIQQKGLIAR